MDCDTPGERIRSGGQGRGLAYGQGQGPINRGGQGPMGRGLSGLLKDNLPLVLLGGVLVWLFLKKK